MAHSATQAAIGTPEWFAEINLILDTLGDAQEVDNAVATITPTEEQATGPIQININDKKEPTELNTPTEVNTPPTPTGNQSPSINERCLKRCTPSVNLPTEAPRAKRKRTNPKKRCTNSKPIEVTNDQTLQVTQPNLLNLQPNAPLLSVSSNAQATMQMVTTVIPITTSNASLSLTSGSIPLSSYNLDALGFVSEVYDSIFAPSTPGTSDLEQKIRSIVMKKILLDNTRNALPSLNITNFEDIIQFIFNRFREISYMPI